MLSIKNLNKYYFKKKSNEIHVLNNINLDFKDKGLYFLLGPSGSGKSTLLNAIGLLDNFDNGSITIEDNEIKKYKNVDDIRNMYFGYVFQNYLLNEEISVYDNLAIVLKLINYKGDYYKRIEEVLVALGMEKYIKRKAKDLSGGQKQRIGIARCLIKSPKIILMDEPTGNLDEKNSVQVMDIAKSLSKNCLIIIVSHDENLAYAYGDYIIRLKDGQVIDNFENANQRDININDSNHIYLKDYECKSVDNVNIYSNSSIKELNIIIDHNKIYVKGSGDIEVITEKSPITLINDHKKEIKKENINLNIENIETKETKHVLSFFKLLKQSFKTKYKKLMVAAFVITSIIFANSLPFMSSLTSLNPMDNVETNSNTYEFNEIVNKNDLISLLGENDLLISNEIANNLLIIDDLNIPNTNTVTYINASYAPIKDNMKFIYGSISNNVQDVYMDEIIAKRLMNRFDIKSFGIYEIKDFLNLELSYAPLGLTCKIAGIVSTNEPSIYVNKLFLTTNYQVLSSDLTFLYHDASEEILNDGEYLINEEYIDVLDDYNAIGTFKSDYDIKYIANNKTALDTYYNELSKYKLFTNDINKYEDALSVKFTNYRQEEIEEFYTMKNASIISSVVFVAVTISISLIFLYFIMKSSLIHRIKEVGINRSIGVKKHDIYKIFTSEIFAIVIKYSLPGYLLMTLANLYLYNGGLLPGFNWNFVPLGIIVYIVLALIIGLIPVTLLLRKTPSEINKKYDI